jgi:hypothetical protein
MDLRSVFLNGSIKKEVYVEQQPPDFEKVYDKQWLT